VAVQVVQPQTELLVLQTQAEAVAERVKMVLVVLLVTVAQVVQVMQQLLIGVNYGTTLRIS
jgi:hypothetical protein